MPLQKSTIRAHVTEARRRLKAAAIPSDEADLEIDPACAETALASARQYLSSTSFPGSALDLLKSAIARAVKGANRTVAPHDLTPSQDATSERAAFERFAQSYPQPYRRAVAAVARARAGNTEGGVGIAAA